MPATAAGLTAAMPPLSPLEDAFERMHHRLAAHAFAIPLEMPGLGKDASPGGECEAHHPDRLRITSAARTGDAGDRDRDRAAALLQRTLCHFAGGLLADSSIFLQGL